MAGTKKRAFVDDGGVIVTFIIFICFDLLNHGLGTRNDSFLHSMPKLLWKHNSTQLWFPPEQPAEGFDNYVPDLHCCKKTNDS